ncbi:MAG: hypothetical protein ACE5IL_14365 [Myxococcota bacterium]
MNARSFLARLPGAEPMPVTFLDFDPAGHPRSLHAGARPNPRVVV